MGIEEVDREAVHTLLGDLRLELRHPGEVLGEERRRPGHQQRAGDVDTEGEQPEQAHVLPAQQRREEVGGDWGEEQDGGAEADRGPAHGQVEEEQEETVEETRHQEAPPGAGGTQGVRPGEEEEGQRDQQLEQTPAQRHRPGGQRRGQAGQVGAGTWELLCRMDVKP